MSASARPHYATFFREWIVTYTACRRRSRTAARAAAAMRRARSCSGTRFSRRRFSRSARIASPRSLRSRWGDRPRGRAVPRHGLLADGARHLRSARCALRRRRGRVWRGSHRHLVRARAVRRCTRHHDDGEGHCGRLHSALGGRRAAAHRRRDRARLRRVGARPDVLASSRAVRRRPRDGALPPRARAGRARGDAWAACSTRSSRRCSTFRTWATCAAADCWRAVELVLDRDTRAPFPRKREGGGAIHGGGARRRAGGVAEHGTRERRERRHHHARATIHHRAVADR